MLAAYSHHVRLGQDKIYERMRLNTNKVLLLLVFFLSASSREPRIVKAFQFSPTLFQPPRSVLGRNLWKQKRRKFSAFDNKVYDDSGVYVAKNRGWSLVLGMSDEASEYLESLSVDQQRKEPLDYQWTQQAFAIGGPALIGMIADPLLSLIDTVFVGRLGAVPLAALGACTSIFHLAFSSFRATTTATTSLVATSLVRRGNETSNSDEAKIVIDTSLRLGLTIGVVVAATLLIGWANVLKPMGISHGSPLMSPAKSYLRIRALAAPAVLMITVGEGAFRGFGDTRIPLLASLVAAVINLILDPILMFWMKMNVAGASAATVVSQVGAATVYWVYLRRRNMLPRKKAVSEQEAAPKADRSKIIKNILKANLAMMTKQGSLLLAWAYATAKATRIGHYHVAAHQIALSFWLLFAFILDGTAVSAQVLVSLVSLIVAHNLMRVNF